MSKQLSLESLTKKLKNVVNTQDSIPMFSLWIIHHKADHELIVNTWLEVLKTSKPKHRLTLFYLLNDVIQNCKRKKADIFKDSFANVLPEAISFLRDKDILPGVERVLNVWMGRKVYDTELIDQLHAALLTNRAPDTLRQKLLAEYRTSSLIEAISEFKKNEDAVAIEEKQLENINVDASNSQNVHRLKDKIGGEIFSKNFEESATNIERFLVQYEKFVQKRKSLIDELSQGEVFYHAQYHEAKIVVNAYQSFDARVSKMKKLLDQVKARFTPKTPPLDPPQGGDVADMDMSDSDQELGNKPSKIVAVDTNRHVPSKPTSSVMRVAQQSGTGIVNRPGMRGATTSSLFATNSPLKTPSANINIPITFNGAPSGSASKLSTPSASPPSPEGSPELNISSPPRYPSLESRLADLFSGGAAKVALGSATENTGSESETDSISATTKLPSSPKSNQQTVTSDSASENLDTSKIVQKDTATKPEDSASWQNTIPVIGGNRRVSRETSFMDEIRVMQDGNSTPLQDEGVSENDNYQNDKYNSNGPKSSSMSVLPPPSFSGDALNFLTKFMGKKTGTTVSQPEAIPTTSAPATSSGNILQNLNIDWNSIQNITASVGRWPPPPTTTSFNNQTGEQNAREHDTDYRTAANTTLSTASVPPNVSSNSLPNMEAANQFKDILRKKSSELTPNFPPNDDVIVEEEEIVLDEGDNETQKNMNQVHLNNLKDIPTTYRSDIPPPPIPLSPNDGMFKVGQKRPLDEDFRQFPPPPHFPRTSNPGFNSLSRGSQRFPTHPGLPHRPRFPGPNDGMPRVPFRGSFRARVPRPHRPPQRNNTHDPAFANDEYYDMLYDELLPKYPRPNRPRGHFRPRRPFR